MSCPHNQNNKDRNMPNHKIRVEYLDALAGAGKTRAAARWGVNQAHKKDKKIIIAQPSIYLITQTLEAIEKYCSAKNLPVKVTAIYGEDARHGIAATSAHVVGDITKHLNEAAHDIGEILLMTHAAFQLIPYFHRKKYWSVLWDEVLDPIKDITLGINESFSDLLRFDALFDVGDAEFVDYNLVTAKSTVIASLQKIAMNRYQDELYSVLQEFIAAVLSPHHCVYVRKDALHNLRKGFKHTDQQYRKLAAYSVQQASFFDGFDRFIVMSALFKSSTWYGLYEQQGAVKWMPFTDAEKMRYTEHQHANIEFQWLTDKTVLWSKNTYGKAMPDGRSILEHCEQQLAAYLDQPFVFQANKGCDLFADNVFAKPLPYSCHGLNNFMDRHCYVDLAAYNSQSQFYQFCEHFGLDNVITYNRTVHLAYQGLMRTSIRNPDDKSRTLVILPTKKMCEDIARYFPQSANSIHKCPVIDIDAVIDHAKKKSRAGRKTGAVGRDNLWKSRSECVRARRALNLAMKAEMSHISALMSEETDENGILLGPTFIDPKSKQITLTCFANIIRSIAETYEVSDWNWFVNDLKKAHRDSVKSKEDNVLISPATFDVGKCEGTNYGTANVVSAWCIFIDYDSGDASPEMWDLVFPQYAKVIYSTFSSASNNWRYRVVFQTDRAMSAEEYALVARQIAYLFQQRYPNQTRVDAQGKSKECGIDTTKLTASSLFYFPCQAQLGGKSFCNVYEGQAIAVDQLVDCPVVSENPARPIYVPAVNRSVAVSGNEQGVPLWNKLPPEAKEIFDSMGPGCRSHEAQVLAGIVNAANLPVTDKHALLAAMVAEKGIDMGAIQSARRYMGLRH